MKLLLIMAFSCFLGNINAANYYFSSSSGNDSYSSVQAQNPATPWQTLTKLSSFFSNLQPGDSILFKRGDSFYGAINMTKSGSPSLPIIFSAFGSGNKPIISGLTLLSSWTALGNGIWEASCSACGIFVNAVVINDSIKAMGRYPNAGDPNRGYLSFESHNGSTQITDDELPASPNWKGAEVVIRKNNWVLDRNIITQQSGTSITYISPTGTEPNNDFGYFFQNSFQTLDKPGEWYYNPASKKLDVFYGGVSPASALVKASTVDILVNNNTQDNIVLDNLGFEGADTAGINILQSNNILIQNCDFNFSGSDAVDGRNSPHITIKNCSFNNTNNNGIKLYDCSYAKVLNNSITNTGMLAGMGISNNQNYESIYVRGTSALIQLNTVINTGYSAITFSGDSAIVQNNFVNNYTMTLDDGGGIYGWGDYDKHGRKITGNIILNGIGAAEGTNTAVAGNSNGIYLDDRSANVDITGNSIANANRNGIYLHNSHEITVSGNTLFNNGAQLSMIHDAPEPADPIRNINASNNILFGKTTSQLLSVLGSTSNDIQNFGSFSSNYYPRPFGQNGIILANYTNATGNNTNLHYDLKSWQTIYNQDNTSLPSPVLIPPYIATALAGSSQFNNGSFASNINGVFCLSTPSNCQNSWNSGGKLDGGALEIKFNGSGGTDNYIDTHVAIGAVAAGKTYSIKFSMLGSNIQDNIGVYLLKNAAPYNALSEPIYFKLDNTRSENELFFSSATSESDVLLIFTKSNVATPLWIDNLDVREITPLFNNPDDYIRFEYNAAVSPKTVVLDANYIDAKSNIYFNTITLPAFSSAVLIKMPGGLLPLEFLEFTGKNMPATIDLNWVTAHEGFGKSFAVEKSINGIDFTQTGALISSAADSTETGHYSFIDLNPVTGKNYYRIKQAGIDGKYFYSKIIVIDRTTKMAVQLTPNPAHNFIRISVAGAPVNDPASISIINSAGEVVKHLLSNLNQPVLVDISSMPAGFYLVKISSKEININTKLIRQ